MVISVKAVSISSFCCDYFYEYSAQLLGLLFSGLCLTPVFSGIWSGSVCAADRFLQILQVVSLLQLAFNLSGKVVAVHFDKSTAKAYVCNQGGTISFLPG